MGLRDSIKADAISVFANNTDFAEAIIYNFAAGGSRSVNAIVNRDQLEVYNASGDVVRAKFMVEIPGNCVSGVLASEVNTGGDSIELLTEFGGAITETVTVAVLVAQDMGMITLALW